MNNIISRNKFVKLGTLLLLVLLMFGITACGTGNSESDSKDVGKSKTGVFENLKAEDFDGKMVDKSIFDNNKLTIVNVWSTTCPPCIAELPELEKISKEFAEKGVSVKGIVYDTIEGDGAIGEAKSILAKSEVTYQQLKLSKEMLGYNEIAEMQFFPTTFFVNSEGKIVDTIPGAATFEGWSERIEKAMEKLEK